MRLFLRFFYVLFFTFSSSVYADIEQDYEKIFLDVLGFSFWNNDKIFCSPYKKQYNSIYPNANYLLNVASSDYIVVFVHGFQPHKQGGEQTLQEMVNTWKYHIDILEEINGDVSYCVVTWDSEYGFDDKNQTLSKFMYVIERAMSDQRIDNKDKVISYVGHSAGGNYIKYSRVLYEKSKKSVNDRVSSIIPGFYKNLINKKRISSIITMATPHLGAKVADTAGMTSLFASYYLALLLGDTGQNIGQQYAYKANSRGAQQLKSIENGNNALYELNREFARIFPSRNIAAIAGRQDTTVDITSATPSFARAYTLGFDHQTFLQPYKNASLMEFLKTSYTGKIPEVR